MSYNIRYLNQNDGEDVWQNRADAVVATVEQADIVGLQEVVFEQFKQIQHATNEDFEWYGKGRDDGQEAGEMTPIGYRKTMFDCEEQGTFWLSETPEIVGKKSWDAALPRIASWARLKRRSDGQLLLVVNTHFDHRGGEARRQSARLLRKWIAEHREDSPAILLGDLNAQLADPPLQQLLEPNAQDTPPLTDTLAIAAEAPTGPNSTWNGFSQIAEGRRIDHILASGELKVMSFATLDPRTANNRFASDHLPVLATIDW
jgi:endonuclease/exonuclease/phosphatase family metal-dependent hydrolase